MLRASCLTRLLSLLSVNGHNGLRDALDALEPVAVCTCSLFAFVCAACCRNLTKRTFCCFSDMFPHIQISELLYLAADAGRIRTWVGLAGEFVLWVSCGDAHCFVSGEHSDVRIFMTFPVCPAVGHPPCRAEPFLLTVLSRSPSLTPSLKATRDIR